MAVSTASAPVFIGKGHVVAHQLAQILQKSAHLIVSKGSRGQGDAAHLLTHGALQAGMRVPLIDSGISAQTVQIPLTVYVVEPSAFSAFHHNVERFVDACTVASSKLM